MVTAATSHDNPSTGSCFPKTILAIASAESYRQHCRAQLDPGAMLSLVTSKLARSVKAKRIKGTAITISGIGGEVYSPHEVELCLQSLHSSESICIRASVVDQTPSCVSTGSINQVKSLPIFRDLKLADPFYCSGSQTDLLLEMAHCNLCPLVGIVLSDDKLFKAMNTVFGWAVGGALAHPDSSTFLHVAPVQENVEQLLELFWVLEGVPGDNSCLSKDEQLAVSHFRETHCRQPDGRYVVGLPKKDPLPELGHSKETALQGFISNEKSLRRRVSGTASAKEWNTWS